MEQGHTTQYRGGENLAYGGRDYRIVFAVEKDCKTIHQGERVQDPETRTHKRRTITAVVNNRGRGLYTEGGYLFEQVGESVELLNLTPQIHVVRQTPPAQGELGAQPPADSPEPKPFPAPEGVTAADVNCENPDCESGVVEGVKWGTNPVVCGDCGASFDTDWEEVAQGLEEAEAEEAASSVEG